MIKSGRESPIQTNLLPYLKGAFNVPLTGQRCFIVIAIFL